MNYELAKELKDSGFPQDLHENGRWYGEKYVDDPRDSVMEPTLSELIEACGKHYKKKKGNTDWWYDFTLAYSSSQKRWQAGFEGYVGFDPLVRGSTPEEAVARLWLALHKTADSSNGESVPNGSQKGAKSEELGEPSNR